MRSASAMLCLVALSVLVSCNNQVTVVATQPKLVSVGLHGQRVCGNFATTFQQFSFSCPALPTVENSGWQLTPAEIATPHQHPNRTVDLTVTGPSQSALDIEFAYLGSRPNSPVTQIDPHQRVPGEVGLALEAGVTMTDDGTARTWVVQVTVSTCQEFRQLQFFNRGTSASRSNPLVVFVMRAPNEVVCDPGPGVVLPSMAGGAGPGDPLTPAATGACPGGGARRTFDVCENCAVGHPQAQSVFTTYTACDWNEVLSAFGFQAGSAISQSCTITQADRASCEGPP